MLHNFADDKGVFKCPGCNKIEISFAKAIPAPRRKGTLIAPNAESIILATYIATVITPGSAT